MPESVNQTESMTTDDFSFDVTDLQTSDDAQQTEGADTDTTAEPTAQPADAQKQAEEKSFMDIVYNGATEHLTESEAIALAQKGRNYDKLQERLNVMENNPVLKLIEAQARNAGMTTEDYVNKLNTLQEQSTISRIAQQYKQQNPGVDERAAVDYARLAYQQQLQQRQREEATYMQQAEQIRQQRANAEVEAFMAEYPDVDIVNGGLPAEVIEAINNGEPLMQAYRGWEIKQLRAQMQAERKNYTNANKAAGRLSSNMESDNGGDPFVRGLLGE